MLNIKRKLSFVLLAVMILSAVIPVVYASVSTSAGMMSLVVKYQSTTLRDRDVVTMNVGDVVNVTVETPYTEGLEIAYYWNAGDIHTFPLGNTTATITIPSAKAGSQNQLQVQAIINDRTHNVHEVIDKFVYYINIPGASTGVATTIDTELLYNGNTVSTSKTVEIPVGSKLYMEAESNKGVSSMAYRWDDEELMEFPAGIARGLLYMPNYAPGSIHTLKMQAKATDGTKSTPKTYTIKVPGTAQTPSDTEISVALEYEGETVPTNKTLWVYPYDELTVVAESTEGVDRITYQWDEEAVKTVRDDFVVLDVPSDFDEDTTHTLTIQAIAKDGTKSAKRVYTIGVQAEDGDEEDNDELVVEPWMREESDLDTLAVSLRNDSEEEKANKNIYEVGEEVIYYVDYKNGGRATSKKVTLVLNIPETFKVLDADGGSVSTSKGTITWTFNRLDEDEAGTKEVVLKYTKIGTSKVTYKVLKPLAEIKLDNKVKDSSAVMNLIYKDADTEIANIHEPYMFGDANATTFRPDAGITRGEAALVLTRTLGLSTAYDTNTYNYADLNETYLEARKAIVAATAYGLVQGYGDGYYRPNAYITRAEFITIIANRIATDNDDGFEIKDSDTSIKRYKDSTKLYAVNGSYEGEHWALDEVTLLARLNMLPLSNSSKSLRLDEPITRAEVAQYMNFFMLRAPADVSSKTRSGFSDVLRNHKLFADIVEATREEHTYYMTDDTTEDID